MVHGMKPGVSPSRTTANRRIAILFVAAGLAILQAGANPVPTAGAKSETRSFPPFTTESARTYLETVVVSFAEEANDQIEANFIRARFHSYLGQQAEAERWARVALAHDNRRADIHLFLSDLFILQSRLEGARDSLRTALAADPDIDGAQRRLGLVLDRLGDRAGAQAAFETAVRAEPQDAGTRLLLGRLLLDQGEVPSALDHLEYACQLDPSSANAFYALAQAEQRSGKSDRAQATLRTFQELKEKEQAAADAENAARDDARSMRVLAATLHTEIAAYLIETGQITAAESHLRQATAITPDEPLGHEALATFLLETGRRQDALGVCQTLVRLQPDNAGYRLNLGTLLLELNDHPAAIQQLERSIELDPQLPEPLLNLARYYLGARQNPARALELCRRLVELKPTAAQYDLLAWAYYANGQTAEARNASTRSVELDPTNAVYRERLRRLEQLR
jgi:tetratricopeptide (TPR) repeat protein